MLSENQVKRLLKQCEKAMSIGQDDWDSIETGGWCCALRLVLEEDTYPIRKDPIDGK